MNERLRKHLKEAATKATKAWFAVQITHYGGKYSIERMLALEEYTRKTSLFHVLCVVISTPLPTLAMVLCQESIPLQDPAEGWSVNYGFWIRMGIVGFGEGCATSIQTRFFLDGMALSVRQTALLGVCVAVGLTTAAMLVAAYWMFPTPFLTFTLAIALFTTYVATLRLMVGKQRFNHILSQRENLRQCAKFLFVQLIMVSIYPAYQALFDFVSHTNYEIPVLMLLPVLKLVMRNILTFTIWHMEDATPEQVIFTVDFFDAFYLATCMQTSSSITTVIAIMVVDFLQKAADLTELYQRTQDIQTRLGDRKMNNNLLATARSQCYSLETFRNPTLASLQVRSCIFHDVSPEGRAVLSNIDSLLVKTSRSSILLSRSVTHVISNVLSLTSVPPRLAAFLTFRSVVQPTDSVVPSTNPGPAISTKCTVDSTDTSWNGDILHDSLEVLFTAECLVLTEYLETFIPIIYAVFILVMAHLPSAQYHTEMDGVTTENVVGKVQNVFIYAALELVSLAVLAVITWRNCAIRALYQLAFVLETQAAVVQTKLVLWVLIILTYRVAHFGMYIDGGQDAAST